LLRLGDALGEVVFQLAQQWQPARFGTQHGTADAGVLMAARRTVGAVAVAIRHFAQGEVSLHLSSERL
jgi:hypothetical protein